MSNYDEAKRIAKDMGYVSTSLFTRRMRIGYAEASQIVERMENEKFCEPMNMNSKDPTRRKLL